MIMIIAIIYIFFILCDIWSTVENPTLFAKIENFSSPFPPHIPSALQKGGGHYGVLEDDTVNLISFIK